MADETMPVFNPGITPTTGLATNSLNTGATSVAQEQAAMIFAGMGSRTVTTGHPTRPSTSTSRVPIMRTKEQFLYAFDAQDRKRYLKLRNMMIAAGILSVDSADPYSVRSAFSSVLDQVAAMTAAGQKMSPLGFIKNLVQMNGFDPKDIGAKENFDPFAVGEEPDPNDPDGDGNFRMTATQRTISEITEGEAWSALQTNLSQMLGRDPSDQEVRDFTYKMNSLAAKNPAISKTIARFKNGEEVSRTTRTSGGFGAADVAQAAYDDAQSDPGYAEYQAGSTYFNAAMAALGAIGGD